MNTLVLYESQYGNTKQIAELIGKQLEPRGPVRVSPIGGFNASYLEGVDLLVVGGPTQAHGITIGMRHFLEHLVSKPVGIEAAAYDTRIKGPVFLWGSASREIDSKLRAAGFKIVTAPESFLVTMAKEPVLQAGEENRATEWAADLAGRAQAATV
jgi:flavodoxin